MSNTKQFSKQPLKPWLSAKADSKENVFVQIGASLLESERFNELSVSARHLYICMCLVAKNGWEYEFPNRLFKKFGISESTGRRDIKILIKGGFIRLKSSGYNTRQSNIYVFSNEWKKEK